MPLVTNLRLSLLNLIIVVFVGLINISISSCGVTTIDHTKSVSFQDPRDGQSYRIEKFGNQTWFIESLNFNTPESFCYDNIEANCERDGRLYSFSEAQMVCPQGWKLPNENHWRALELTFEMEKALTKEIRIWRSLKKAKEFKSVFNVQYAGMGESNGASFQGKGQIAQFWVNHDGPTGSQFALYRMMMNSKEEVYSDQIPKMNLCCVRCIKEEN